MLKPTSRTLKEANDKIEAAKKDVAEKQTAFDEAHAAAIEKAEIAAQLQEDAKNAYLHYATLLAEYNATHTQQTGSKKTVKPAPKHMKSDKSKQALPKTADPAASVQALAAMGGLGVALGAAKKYKAKHFA